MTCTEFAPNSNIIIATHRATYVVSSRKMPLNCTPLSTSPLSDVNKNLNVANECDQAVGIQHYNSAPDLRSMLENITGNKKRKIDECDTCSTDAIKEIFTLFSQEQAARFEELQSTISGLTEQNSKLTQSVELMSIKYDEFLSRISQLESESRADKKTIASLEGKLESLERKSRSTGIEIRNIPKKTGENKRDLCALMQSVGQVINVQIDSNNVSDIYRIKSKDSSNPIIVELTTVLHKEKILDNVKKYNKSKKPGEKLNTSTLGLQCPVKPVFISETLTAKTQKLFYLARTFQQQYNYSFCWTSHGVVYLRKKEKDQHIRINSEVDIDNLRKSD